MKKIFTDNLPHNWKGVDWKNTVGYTVHFVYDDIEDDFNIIDYIKGENYYNKIVTDYHGLIRKICISSLDGAAIGNIIGKYSNEYRYNVNDKFTDNNRNITLIKQETRTVVMPKRTDNVRGYIYKCNICGWENGWLPETMVIRGIGCSCCSGTTVVEGINDIPTTAPWMVDFFPDGYEQAKLYAKRSEKKLRFKCPYCGKISEKERSISNLYRTKSIPCMCNDKMSASERYMHNLLNQLLVDNQITNYNSEIKFDWCKFYNSFTQKYTFGIYDFIIEEKKLIIETDGGFHRMDNKISGQTKEESKYRDDKKDYLANINGYKVIRISDEGDIKNNILNSELASLFNLNVVNWNKCIESSCNNMVRVVCDFKRVHQNYSVKRISSEFHLGEERVRSWLKIGNSLGWCVHNGHMTRNVICIETGKVYESAKLCVEDFKDINPKFTVLNIRNSLRSHGLISCFRYHFKYLDECTDEESFIISENVNREKLRVLFKEQELQSPALQNNNNQKHTIV